MDRPKMKRVLTILVAILVQNIVQADPTVSGGENVSAGDASDGERTVYACNGLPLILKCQNTNKTRGIIKVTRANFGRFSIALCNEEGRTDWSVNCFTPKAKKIISENCDDKEDCSLSADDFDLGPNPCPDTERYLEAHYVCIQTALARPPDVPPWLKSSGDYDESRPSINSRRKPERRVPITAPPTKPSLETTTMSLSRERTRPETPFPEEAVSAAPVFYENRNVGSASVTEVSRDGLATSRTLESSSPSSVEDRISPEEIVNEMPIPIDRDVLDQNLNRNESIFSVCPARRSRGIFWLEVPIGSIGRRPCPNGGENGHATWECVLGRDSEPVWKNNWPDLSGCQSSWTRQLELNSAKGKIEMTHTADTLERQLQHGSLFGGDLRSILNIVSSTLLKIKAETDHDALAADRRDDQFMVLVEREVVHKMARTLSGLLERRQLPAWHDVTVTSQRKSTLEMLMSVTEEMGDVIAQMSLDLSRDEDDIEENTSHVMNTASHLANLASQLNEQEGEEEPTIILTPNIYLTRQKLGGHSSDKRQRSRSKSGEHKINLPFTFPSQPEQHDEPGLVHHRAVLELHFESGSNSSHGSVPIVAVVFRNVDRILNIEPTSAPRDVSSLVLSIVPPKFSKILILKKVTYEIPIVAPTGTRAMCVMMVNHSWTPERCQVSKRNATHVSCLCQVAPQDDSAELLWTRFSITEEVGQALVDGEKYYNGGIFRSAAFDDMSTATIVIVAVSAALLVGSLLAAALLVIYCRRVKIRDKKWEETGSRPCYLRKSATTLEVGTMGTNDYSELRLLQQQQQQQQQLQHQQIPHSHHATLLLKGGQGSPSGHQQRLGMLACIATNNYERTSNEGQQVNAHVNLLHSRSESDLENEVEIDRYAHYEVARPPSSSYTTTLTSSSTPHLLMGDNTIARQQLHYQQQQQQPYSAYYQSFGRPLKSEKKEAKNKISSWLKTKLSKNDTTKSQRRNIERSQNDFSYTSGGNSSTLIRRQSDFNAAGSGGGSLALLLRHKNCPAEGRQFTMGERMPSRVRPYHQDMDPHHTNSPTLSLRSENNFFLPDPFSNARAPNRNFRPQQQNNFLHHTSRRHPPQQQQQDDEARKRSLGLHFVTNDTGVDAEDQIHFLPSHWNASPVNQQFGHSGIPPMEVIGDSSELQQQQQQQQQHQVLQQQQQRPICCPAIFNLPPPPPPPPTNRPSLYEDLDENPLNEKLLKSPSEPWPTGLPVPWLATEAIYHLPLDTNHEWHLQQQQQRKNLLRFSSSSSASEETKNLATKEGSTKPVSSRRATNTKSGRKKRKSSTDNDRQSDTVLSHQPIYMEVEDSGYTEESSTPSSGNNTNNTNSHVVNSNSHVVNINNIKLSTISPASTCSSASDNFLPESAFVLSGPRSKLAKSSESQLNLEAQQKLGAKNCSEQKERNREAKQTKNARLKEEKSDQ